MSWVWHETASNAEAPVLEIWWVWSTSSLWPGVFVPVRVPFMGQIDLCADYLYKTEILDIKKCKYVNVQWMKFPNL